MSRLAVAAILCASALSAAASTAGPAPAATKPSAPAKEAAVPADGGDPVTCTGTLSGAVKGRFTCKVTVGIDGEVVSFKVEALDAVAGVRTLVPAAFELAAPLRTRTYTREAVTTGSAVVELAGGARYTASGRRGEIALDLTSAERYRQSPKFYVVSGTLKAHLVADAAALGEVVLELAF
jgi:hypothetical protein